MSAREKVIVILMTAPDAAAGAQIARALLEERLIACANVVPAIRSLYRWEGRVEDSEESLVVMKSTAGVVDAIAARVRQLHPYDVPEVVATEVVAGLEPYLDWVREETDVDG